MVNRDQNKAQHVDWVDLTKGLTILLVVVMHSIGGVEKYLDAEGWMHPVLAFATPFRMPVFFAVAGLFAARAITKDWSVFLDKKFVHFGYFYFLWMTIEFIFKTPFFIQQFGAHETALYYVTSFVQPFGPLWFIYLLPFYFLTLRLTRPLPMPVQFALAIASKFLLTTTGIIVIDDLAKYYVFFLAGHFGRDIWFSLANSAREQKLASILGLIVWAAANGLVVWLGYGEIVPVAIVMGVLGFMAVVDFMGVITQFAPGRALAAIFRYMGRRSLPIYLGFFLPMGITRILVMKFGNGDPGLSAFIVSMAAVIGAIAMYEVAMRLKIGSFLYVRPGWARLKRERKTLAFAAE
nr:acyltransferase family protein [uncultured Cohaesibacter sp.]